MNFSDAITSTPIERKGDLLAEDTKEAIYRKYEDILLIQEPCLLNIDVAVKGLLPIGTERKILSEKKESIIRNRSSSSLLLEFDLNGENMVSKLCDSDHSITDLLDINYKFANININSTNANDVAVALENIALSGLNAADIIIKNSSNKCFNGMNYLCSKAKGNIERKDSAVIKLHSQGLPWVIKSFIMSFLRIIDGWKSLTNMLGDNRKMKITTYKNQYLKVIESFKLWEIKTKDMLFRIHKTSEYLTVGLKYEQQKHSSHMWNNCNLKKNNFTKDSHIEIYTSQIKQNENKDSAQFSEDVKRQFQLIKERTCINLDTENLTKIDSNPLGSEESNQNTNKDDYFKSYAEITKIKNYSEACKQSVLYKKYTEDEKICQDSSFDYSLPKNFNKKNNKTKLQMKKSQKNKPPECYFLPKFVEKYPCANNNESTDNKMAVLNDIINGEDKNNETEGLQSYVVYNSGKKHQLNVVSDTKIEPQLRDMQRLSKKIREKNTNKTQMKFNKKLNKQQYHDDFGI